MDDLAHARMLCDQLGDTCLTYLKGVDAAGALHRLGALPGTVADRTGEEIAAQRGSSAAGFPRLAAALEVGGWTVVIEPGGVLGADHALLEVASRGGAAVTVLRDAKATAHFAYVVDGVTVTAFDPGFPTEETTWGSDPQFLRRLMDALDLRPPSEASEHLWQDAEARAIVLAQRITGVRIPERPLAAARVSAELEPWFVTPAPRRDLLRADRRAPYTGELVAAARAAGPERQRAVAAAELRRQAAVLGIAGAPGLAEALDAAERKAAGPAEALHAAERKAAGPPEALHAAGPVGADSVLGREVRSWLADARRGAAALECFLAALRGGLDQDPEVAVLAAVKPYASGLPGLADEEARDAVLRALRDAAG